MFISSKLLQNVTGLPEIVFTSEAYLVKTLGELVGENSPFDAENLGPNEWEDYVEENTVDVSESGLPGDRKFESRLHSTFDGFDVRKMLSLEVSLPIPHTLAWDGNNESTRFVLQEFQLPGGLVNAKYIIHPANAGDNTIQLREEQLIGPSVLLNGGSNMAIKKLFEGQLQAFRIDLILHYDEWDSVGNTFVRREKHIEMSDADFLYLKLLFTKETL